MDSRTAPQLKLESRYATKESLAALQKRYQSQMPPVVLAPLAVSLDCHGGIVATPEGGLGPFKASDDLANVRRLGRRSGHSYAVLAD